MSDLEQFRDYVASRYESVLGTRLSETLTADSPNPVWLADENSAWLLDREIGLALRVLPYEGGSEEVSEAVQLVLRYVSHLQPRPGLSGDEVDAAGLWQAGILWLLADARSEEVWRSAVADIRRESGFSEELGLDAILVRESSVAKACDEHGLPQLLLNARRLIGMSLSEMPAWLSANVKVSEMLSRFADKFSGDTETRHLASALVTDALDWLRTSPSEGPTAASEIQKGASLEEIEMQSFRNLQRCRLRFPKDRGRHAQAHVVFGPNGSGKTSIFEALCLAGGGASRNWETYLADGDIETRARDYVREVLTPLGGVDEPKLFLNGQAVSLSATLAIQGQWGEVDGSFLGQEDSRAFLDESGAALAERILKGYSTLANRVTELAGDRERSARDEKSAWLRANGLNASISRRETRAQKLIESEIRKYALAASESLLDWLERTSLVIPDLHGSASALAERWRTWGAQQTKVISEMAKGVLLGDKARVESPLEDWLTVRNEVSLDTSTLLDRARSLIEGFRARAAGVDREIDIWGEWLARQENLGGKDAREEQATLVQQIEVVRERLRVARQGIDLVRKQALYLDQLTRDFLTSWASTNPNTCPTCGADHSQSGGIAKAVAEVGAAVEKRLTQFENDERQLTQELQRLESRLSSLGLSPISEARQEELQKLLAPLVGTGTLRAQLVSVDGRVELKRDLRAAQTLPDVPAAITSDGLRDFAQRLAEVALSLDGEAERLWPLPERWKKIVIELRSECDRIVATHLLATLQRLWWEIALALTSARWNLPGRPVFQVKSQGKLIVGMTERPDTPVRYLLNQAERHILGLAWFAVRYLTHGRFRRTLLVLDDPAQEMDQTTFRAFARYMQTLLRIHECRRLPLQLIIFLHQEDRALDISRATMGRLLILNWRKSIRAKDRQDVRELRMNSEGFQARNGLSLFSDASSVLQ